jgi:catechol 2,3-dioxygenase-like lactoylglutathione lyase family enzyme
MTQNEPTSPPTKHLRRICPTLAVADAGKAAAYYVAKLGFKILHDEGSEFAIVARDDCRIFLKRGLREPSPTRNRDRCGEDFYDLFIHCDSMPAFEALRREFEQSQPLKLGPIEEWGEMRLFSLHDLDGYKIYFARSI